MVSVIYIPPNEGESNGKANGNNMETGILGYVVCRG